MGRGVKFELEAVNHICSIGQERGEGRGGEVLPRGKSGLKARKKGLEKFTLIELCTLPCEGEGGERSPVSIR